MTDSRKPIRNRNYLPISHLKIGTFDLEKSYHKQLEKFVRQSDKQIEKYSKSIKRYKNATREEFGDFTAARKALGI